MLSVVKIFCEAGESSLSRDQLTTLQFCRATDEGDIAPSSDAERDEQLRGQFEIGLTVDSRYFLKEILGNGSMGRVFLAHDLRLDRSVAMKVVAHDRIDAHQLETVLEREARLGASLNHKNLAAVYDFGFHDNKSYTIFEYVEGQTLRELLDERGCLPLDEVRQIAGDLAPALDYAHARGVVHRDLKPENICFTSSGEFKILDLGIALETRHEEDVRRYCGTPAYSSPEQAACRATDGRSDQYSLAAILFELMAGRRLFSAATAKEMLDLHEHASPPQLGEFVDDCTVEMESALERALAKLPEDRFATCQDFVRCLGPAEQAWRHVVATRLDQRIGFYLGHVAEESLLARNLAAGLEHEQYRCWYYGRDAIPGTPFVGQSTAAMDRSQAIVFLISRAALLSSDLQREIEYAHRIGRPLAPLLIDLSREEFESTSPSWLRLLAASPLVEYRRADPLPALIARLRSSAVALAIEKDEQLIESEPLVARPRGGHIWATDANQIDINDLDRVLFHNATIDDFLDQKHQHFVSATKGFGKTLLLTCKRKRLTQWSKSTNQALTMVPEGRPYLDFMSEMRTLSSKYEAPLSDLSTTKRLWSMSLRISAISHHPSVIEADETDEVDAFPQRIRRWLRGARIEPTVVFKELTTLRVSELNRLIDSAENFLDQKIRRIHGGLCFFIDKVDQAIRHLSRDAWIAIQAGLIEAAWETMNANSHIKIFASIRQEAFSNYQSDIKSNLFAATTTLDYNEDELRALLDQLSRCYEGYASFADLIGLNVVRHGRRPAPEDSFQYVRRHTCGRPRDLVAMAAEISSKRESLSEKRLRDIVQQTSSIVIVSNIFDEVRAFLSCLSDRESRRRFLDAMPSNILLRSDAVRACEEFNGLDPGTLTHFGEDSSDIFHPFRDLYFAGLLGVLRHDHELGVTQQRFRRPHDAMSDMETDLPESPVYLLHPALDTYIRANRTRKSFVQLQHIRVGHQLPWENYFESLIQLERQLVQVPDAAFVDLTHQVIKRIQSLRQAGGNVFPRIEIERSDEWRRLREMSSDDGAEEAMFWLEELLGRS